MHDMDFKKKALGGIKEMLEGRMTERLKPKAPPAEEGAVPADGDVDDVTATSGDDGLPPGAENLTPEERATLKELYEKMGC